jgi:hypothetical protein
VPKASDISDSNLETLNNRLYGGYDEAVFNLNYAQKLASAEVEPQISLTPFLPSDALIAECFASSC